MKVVVIIDYKVQHDLANPTSQELKQLGHDLVVLYHKCTAFAVEQSLDSAEWFGAGTLEHETIEFLAIFAKQSRYYNLNRISGAKPAIDPLAEWARIHHRIALTYISPKFRQRLNNKAIELADSIGAFGYERWIDGEYITNVEAIYLHSLLKKSNPYCVWTLLRVLKPFYKLLDALWPSTCY